MSEFVSVRITLDRRKRTWRERLFSWPWRPMVREVETYLDIPRAMIVDFHCEIETPPIVDDIPWRFGPSYHP